MIDIKEFREKLLNLSGLDFEECEKQERETGNYNADVTYSKSFQARLAAKALNMNPHDLKGLKLAEYVPIITVTSNFLLGTLGEAVQPTQSEEPAGNSQEQAGA